MKLDILSDAQSVFTLSINALTFIELYTSQRSR